MTTSRPTIVISAPYFPPQVGGVERYTFEIAKQLQDRSSYRVVVITSGARFGGDVVEVYEGLTVYRLGYRFKLSNTPFSLRWLRKVRSILKKEAPDIVNVHLPVPGLGDIVSLFTPRKKLVITYHGQSMKKGALLPDVCVWLYEHTLLPFLLWRAKHIVCSSEWIRQHFLRPYRYKSVTIPPGVDTKLFRKQGSERAAHTMLFVVADLSHACEYKGLPMLLRALYEVRQRNIPAKLVVVGDGDMKESYQTWVRTHGLESVVEFTGRLQGEELEQAYAGASFFVLPTSNDSYPTVILEAMAAGLPVISTTVGDIPTMVDDSVNGYVIPPNDTDALVEKMSILLTDPLKLASFGVAAQQKIAHGFGWQGRAERYKNLFEELLTPRRLLVHCLGYYPPHLGGMEQRVQELATILAKRGERVRVFTSSVGTRARKEIQKGVEVFYLRTVEFAHTPLTLGLIPRLLFLPKGSILHLHVAQAFFPEVVALVAWIRGFPYVAHVRLLLEIPSGFFGILLPLYSKFILGPVLRGANKVIVLTPGYKDILQNTYRVSGENIVTIPNATTFTRVSQPRSTPHTPLRILAVGRISVQKNYPLMLEIAAHLKKEYGLQFTLTIVGEGDDRVEMEARVCTLGIEHEVHFKGDVRGESLQKIYEESDLFLHTAFVEGFGTVFIEAMAKGLPIVAPNVVGIKDVVIHERNGLLCPSTAEEMSKAVVRIANDPALYVRFSETNLADVDRYNWDTIADRVVALYKTL